MTHSTRNSVISVNGSSANLVYDTDGVSLNGVFTDQMAAYRAKRHWAEVFHTHFLLDQERDYEMKVISCHEERRYCLSCSFESACGRYAFWRLINHQAPDAERLLGGQLNSPKNISQSRRSSENRGESRPSWIFGALEDEIERTDETRGIIERLIDIFR